MMKQKIAAIILLFLIVFPAWCQEEVAHPIAEDRFLVEGGLFWVSRNFEIGADGEVTNRDIDFNETFGLTETEPTYYFQFGWRFSKRWTVSLQSFGVSAGDGAVLEEDIEFDNVTFNKGSFVEGGVNFGLYRLYFNRKVFLRPKHEISVGIGVHGLNIEAYVEGEVSTSEGDTGFERRSVSGLIPLPNIGASYLWFPHERWMIGATVDWFGITIDQYSGGLWNIGPRIKFQIVEHFGVGFDYRFFLLNARVKQESWNGNFDLRFTGPLFTLHGNF